MKQKEEAQIKQEKDYEAQQKEIERLTAWIEKWKNTPTKVAATRSKRMAIEHMVKIEKPRRFDTRTFHALFHPVRESYTDVLTMKKLKIGYDTVLSEVSAVIKKAERIVIIGENGKGKSTLLKTVVGEINPLGGSYQFGNRVDFAYFDQHKAVNQKFDPEQTVLDYFWSFIRTCFAPMSEAHWEPFCFPVRMSKRKWGSSPAVKKCGWSSAGFSIRNRIS